MISVIVPVYNTSAYVEECVRSILNQSYTNFELILIDDGSKDNSLDICQRLSGEDNRIIVLHQENKGVSAARKLGVEHSRGDILCFVDSDDTIDKDALSIMISKMTDDTDIVITWERTEQTISGAEYVNRLLQKTTNLALWGKLYRRELVLRTHALDIPREIYIGEDQLGNIRMALWARKVACLPFAIYVYRDNQSSVWRTRKWSLEYEEMFRNIVKVQLNNRINEFRESWYKFQLYILSDLICHDVSFSYKRDWIAEILVDKHRYNLSMRENIVKRVRNRHLCHLILKFCRKLKGIFK